MEVPFFSFDSFYAFLDFDLRGAILYGYDFEGIDIKKYRTRGSYISGAVLRKFGKGNNSFYEKNVLASKDLFQNSSAEENSTELFWLEEKHELVEYYYFDSLFLFGFPSFLLFDFLYLHIYLLYFLDLLLCRLLLIP